MDYQFDDNYTISENELGKTISHPAFGTMAFYRKHGGPETLFGSSLKHNDIIECVIRHAHVTRGLHNDWYGGDNIIVSMDMSYSQFVEIITNMNSGSGMPVTIRWTEKDGKIPHCHYIDKYQEFQSELMDKMTATEQDADTLYQDVKTLFDTKKNISKSDRETILAKLDQIVHGTKHTTKFALSQFQEQMDKTVQEAKGEIEAYTENKMRFIAQQALAEHADQLIGMEIPVHMQLPHKIPQTEMTVEKMTEILKNEIPKDIKLDADIREFYDAGDKSIGVSYETDERYQPVYRFHIFVKGKYIHIPGAYETAPEAAAILTDTWNQYH